MNSIQLKPNQAIVHLSAHFRLANGTAKTMTFALRLVNIESTVPQEEDACSWRELDMSDFGAAPQLDWTLKGTAFDATSWKWGLPLLPHLCESFANVERLPALEVCLDRLLSQGKGSVDRSWARHFAQKTDVCLLSRLSNLAANDPAGDSHLANIRECISEVAPRWVAFAVGFDAQQGQSLNIPMPVPRTLELVNHVSSQVKRLQDVLGREIALTNVSSMFRYSFDTMSETEFWTNLIQATGAKILFDVPAYYVSLYHQDLDFESELARFPLDSVASVRVGALALSNHGAIDAECGRLSVTHWGLLEDVLHKLPVGEHKAIFLKWFEPLVSSEELVNEIINGQSTLRRLGEL
ncbi:DUF692 family protein [bacterium]|nr:DUF692 family protein [bacterium]